MKNLESEAEMSTRSLVWVTVASVLCLAAFPMLFVTWQWLGVWIVPLCLAGAGACICRAVR